MKAIFHIFITRAFNCLGKCGVIIKKVSTLLWSQHGTPHRTDWTHEVFISLDFSITSKYATRFTGRPFLFNTLSLNAMWAWHVCLVKNYREQKYILDATTTASWSHFHMGVFCPCGECADERHVHRVKHNNEINVFVALVFSGTRLQSGRYRSLQYSHWQQFE